MFNLHESCCCCCCQKPSSSLRISVLRASNIANQHRSQQKRLVHEEAQLTCFPRLKGMYLYFIMCAIWRLIVRTNRTIQQQRSIGQKTGMSKKEKNVITKAMKKALVMEYLPVTMRRQIKHMSTCKQKKIADILRDLTRKSYPNKKMSHQNIRH